MATVLQQHLLLAVWRRIVSLRAVLKQHKCACALEHGRCGSVAAASCTAAVSLLQ